MSKAGRPRPRYIAFRTAGEGREQVQEALRTATKLAGLRGVELTRFEAPYGIVRCDSETYPLLRDLLPRVSVGGSRLEPLLSSGTIRTLTTRLGVLSDR